MRPVAVRDRRRRVGRRRAPGRQPQPVVRPPGVRRCLRRRLPGPRRATLPRDRGDWAAGACSTTGTTARQTDSPRRVDSRVDELIDDFRLACVSRAIDDREISMQKQSRVFFQISGAGHEALLPRPRPPPAARATTGSSRTTATRRSCSGSASRPTEILLQAVGSADDPGVGRPPDAVPLGPRASSTSSPSRAPTGSQCLPAVGCAEAARYIVRRPRPARLRGLRRRAHLRVARRGRDVARASSGRA